ncbi:MAG: glycogen/starch/alpha-glucan family phosphorylase [Clostridia bacterium]|nr:glycogen/starch/alpha-glucan family phosphorylase [Clostridia bacterium]
MMTATELIAQTEKLLLTQEHITLEKANAIQLHNALSAAAMEALTPTWIKCEEERATKRQAYYLSCEYLVGRMVYNNLFCLGLLDEARQLLAQRGVDLAILEDIEDDAFGNGGLGRLAACFLDSAATHGVPLTGYGLRYRYGLFKQIFVDGRQHEEPDDWSRFGDPWSIRRLDQAVIVPMKTGDVLAVPYDMPVIGYGAKSIGTLRLWQCESLKDIDFPLFNQQKYSAAVADKIKAENITKFLYPNDSRRAGKLLRVEQQYVLVSASMQDLFRAYKARHGSDYSFFAAEHAVQLNDTHPVMAIPEIIRLLMADGVSFEEAFQITRETCSYTNHTVMQEALEKWDLPLLSAVCPEIVRIIRKIDARFKAEMAEKNAEVSATRCIIWPNRWNPDVMQVHMAQLALYASHTINGVAAIHSQILKDDVFADWFTLYPERFQNKTNGITQRRWLGLCNPELSALIKGKIGDGFLTDLYQLEQLKPHINDDLCRDFIQVKHEKKLQLAAEIAHMEGVVLDPNMIFQVQVKRLHEYKRQLMNALSILGIYYRLKDGLLPDFTPTAFIFGAKAAAGYARAKAVIHLINMIADMVNDDPDTCDKLKVVFVQNYNCSWAEKIIPAADISEQISPAGTEASGTGNMKLMLNGAVTLGTFDGANIEIVEQAGRENNYIFGATVEELNAIKGSYDPKEYYNADPLLARCLDALVDGTFPDEDGALHELHSALLEGASWHAPDHYFILKDFASYMDAKLRANRDYKDSLSFARKCLMNVASAGKFSSDRTIQQYAEEIWRV